MAQPEARKVINPQTVNYLSGQPKRFISRFISMGNLGCKFAMEMNRFGCPER